MHPNQNKKMSGSGNVFRRLDQRADLRDTLIESKIKSDLNSLQPIKSDQRWTLKDREKFLLKTFVTQLRS